MKTFILNKRDVKHNWHLIDAKDKVLGRLSTHIASLLKGKHKVVYTPHVDNGDGVVIINAEKIKITGNKLEQKTYVRVSGYPGGRHEETLGHLLARRPTEVIRNAVWTMLPKNRLRLKMMRRLKVYAGEKHKQDAQISSGKAKKEDK